MRFLPFLMLLSSCGLADMTGDQLAATGTRAAGGLGRLAAGDYVGGGLELLDVILILTGLKAVQKGTDVVKRRVMNPPKTEGS